ncbi:MAG: acyclic terpene utilization AtuA family protein, partial [Acidimicrobiales bacterium]
MVEGGPIDVLTGDWLAELTMLILARSQAKRNGGGYARTFVAQMERVMGSCLDRGIKVVSNAGGLDPDGCAAAVAAVADKLGLAPTIATVTGDNLLAREEEMGLRHFETGEPIEDVDRFISANAYVGGWGIAEALKMGADIVVTGRATDAAVVCGPAAWHHGWAADDWDQLAGAIVAGHVIECGTQATGGNYSFFTEIDGLRRAGFPWAEISADGSSTIGKHDKTGGAVDIGTVTSQLLYEIGGPAYLNPDVTSRFDTIELDQVGDDRVRIHGTKGEPPPPTLKVALNELGGYRQDIALALVGLDIEAKAALIEDAFWEALGSGPASFDEVTIGLDRTDKADPGSNAEAVAAWRLTIKDRDETKLGRPISDTLNELGLATIPGFFGLGGGGSRPYGVYTPALIDAAAVPQYVAILGGNRTVVDSTSPTGTGTVTATPGPQAQMPEGETRPVPLGTIIGARSGDKGGDANLGVFARTDAAWAWLDAYLTVEELKALLPEAADLVVERHVLASIRSLNFVIKGLLQEGVAASTRQDGQAKSLGEWLRARVVDVPVELL